MGCKVGTDNVANFYSGNEQKHEANIFSHRSSGYLSIAFLSGNALLFLFEKCQCTLCHSVMGLTSTRRLTLYAVRRGRTPPAAVDLKYSDAHWSARTRQTLLWRLDSRRSEADGPERTCSSPLLLRGLCHGSHCLKTHVPFLAFGHSQKHTTGRRIGGILCPRMGSSSVWHEGGEAYMP